MLFDPHLRAAGLSARDVADLRWFGVEGALCPVEAAEPPSTAATLRRAWEDLSGRAVPRLRRAGLGAFAALAVPSPRIPLRGLEALLADLPEFLSRRGVAAMGPLGPAGGSPRADEALSRQLELARELRLPVLLAAPDRDALRVTRRTVAILRESGIDPARVLVDGADARTVRVVRAVGYLAVVPLPARPGAVDEAARLVRSLGPEGIALASHSGHGAGDLLALPRAADRMGRLGLSEAVIRRACGRNALAALGLAPAQIRSAAAPIFRSARPTSR
jgi:predicted metal-dependent TIM-barrel fold hydrolase